MTIQFVRKFNLKCDCGNESRFLYVAPEIVTYRIEGYDEIDGDVVFLLDPTIVTREPEGDLQRYRYEDQGMFKITCCDCGYTRFRIAVENQLDGYLTTRLTEERLELLTPKVKPVEDK